MRLKIAGVLLIAGTVVGCASNTPPPRPPPMAMAPEPAPAPAPPPAMAAPSSGTYRGTAELTSDQRGCKPLTGSYTARVRNNTITVAGVRGRIGPDGTISGGGLSGTV